MKYSTIILIALIAIFTSCSDKDEELIDFSGSFEGELDCQGELEDSKGEEVTLTITKTGESSYSINFGEEAIFLGKQSENVLVIDEQTINEDLGFDVVTLEGEIRYLNDEFIFDFTHNVDDEGESTCSFPIVKI